MTRLSDLIRFIPPEFIAAANLSILIAKIEEYERKVAELETQLDDAQKVYTALSKIKESSINVLKDPSLAMLGTFINTVDSQLSALELQGEDNLTTTEEFKSTVKNVARAKELHEDFTRLVQPIGSQSYFEKDIADDASSKLEIGDINIGFSVDADAKYALSILNPKQSALIIGEELSATDILINQDIQANLVVGAKASTAIKAIKLSIGTAVGGGVELDTYYQANATLPTYRALWEMHRDTFQPWESPSALKALNNTNSQGYRAFSTKTKRTFSAWGKVELGKSLSSSFDANGSDIDLKIAAKASYSRKYAFEGMASLFVTKNKEEQLVVRVDFDDETLRSSSTNFSLKAQFQGINQLAQRYADIILGQGNKLIAFLELFSQPGQTIIDKVVASVDDESWYKPFALLALGQSSTDDVANELVLNQLQEVIDRELFSYQESPEALANLAIENVLSRFSLNVDDIALPREQRDAALSALNERLTAVIADTQRDLQAQIQSFTDEVKAAIRNDAKSLLEPLASLGEQVAAAIGRIDSEPLALFNSAVEHYQIFTSKLASAIEKAENVKFELALAETKKAVDIEQAGFEVRFLSENHSPSAQLLYQYLLLGVDAKADLLMQSLIEKEEIRVDAQTLLLSSKLQRTSTQSLSLLGFKAKSRKVDVAKLSLEVSADGDLIVKNSVRVTDAATTDTEKRRAAAGLTYKFAQAGFDKKVGSAFSLSYLNEENEQHSPRDIRVLLSSFCYPEKRMAQLKRDMPTVVTKPQIENAVERYSQTYKDFASSSLSIKMRGGKKIYNALLALDKDDVFEAAVDFQLAIYVESGRKEFISTAMQAFEREAIASGNEDWSYRDFFDNASTHTDGLTINPARFLRDFTIRFERDRFFEQSLWESAATSENTKYSAAMGDLSKIGEVAAALSDLPANLNEIHNLVSSFSLLSDDMQLAELEELNIKLKEINEEVTKAVSPWINVDSVTKDFFEDILGRNDINVRLASFIIMLTSLFASEHKRKPLFRMHIKLEKERKQPKLILV